MTSEAHKNYENLNPQEIVDAIHLLSQRTGQRFPDSGLFRICQQLHRVSENMMKNRKLK